MKIFGNSDLRDFLKKAQKSADYGVPCEEAALRFCKACVRATYFEEHNDFLVVLQSYAWDAITLFCDDCGRVSQAEFSPYCSMTTWQHVRKFCALFQNGRELYSAYSEAAHGGRVNRYFKRG